MNITTRFLAMAITTFIMQAAAAQSLNAAAFLKERGAEKAELRQLARSAFYVLDVRHTGEAMLHANTEHIPKADQQYALADTGTVNCCFRFGTKPGMRKPSIKIDEDAPPLTSSIGEETYSFAGYLTAQPGTGKRAAGDTLAFGVVGMANVTSKERNTYEVAFSDGSKPLFVRKCLGAEGVNFRLYHDLTEKKPFVTYYFALGYDTKPDCR